MFWACTLRIETKCNSNKRTAPHEVQAGGHGPPDCKGQKMYRIILLTFAPV